MSKFFPTMPVGLRGGLIRCDHFRRMGNAVWLFMWAVLRQTGVSKDGTGIVNYGRPITYKGISVETDIPRETIRKWMKRLCKFDYLRTRSDHIGFVLEIPRTKKGISKQKAKAGCPGLDTPPVLNRTAPLSKRGGHHPSKRQKTFGFQAPILNDLRNFSTKNRPLETAALSPPVLDGNQKRKSIGETSVEMERQRQLKDLEKWCKEHR